MEREPEFPGYTPAMWTRRQFGLLGTGLCLPQRLLAAPVSASERRFLFIFCDGGWDTGFVFTPLFDIPEAGFEGDATTAEVSGITFVDHAERPAVRDFFTNFGDQTCVVNGLQVQSITHERCRRLILTSQGEGGDDWPSILAANGSSDLLLPHLILDGPGYTDRYTSSVVRVGDAGQLPNLLDGTALSLSDTQISHLPLSAEALEEAFVLSRATSRQDAFGEAYRQVLERVAGLKAREDIELGAIETSCERDIAADCGVAFDTFSQDLSRCAMVRYQGWCEEGWDTHQGIELQSTNFEDLFLYLAQVMTDLQGRTAASGRPLSEEVTICVFSEMGREPRYNSWQGKDHWTFTSAMLIGSGIRGGQVVGALDQQGQGELLDLSSGAITSSGTALGPEHLGATLLALGDVDPGDYLVDPAILDAVRT